jgi:deoxyribodipyrimidine photolyase-related protein
MEITLVFPHQLYHDHPAIRAGRAVLMIEEPLFFLQFPFHKKKLLLHRASMKRYQAQLETRGFTVFYIEAKSEYAETGSLIQWIRVNGYRVIYHCDPTDYLLTRRLQRYTRRAELKLITLESPNFLTSVAELHEYFGTGRRFFMADFYKFQRKRLGVLINHNSPVGGKWSFDEENRKKIPNNLVIPALQPIAESSDLRESIAYIEREFASNYGELNGFDFPIDHDGALQLLHDFLQQRFPLFGIYQDAIVKNQHYLFHSVLSSSINSGLLSPHEVLKATVEYAQANDVPINSVEGFIRQLIGWREYVRAVYLLKGVEERTRNYFGFSRPLPAGLWNATTYIDPVDSVVNRLLEKSYSHHIERLMIMGNFMLLSEIDPDEVYRWFMTLYIDAYDWVMVPNVYGMSQFADGGMMSTKPYISSSNYLLKMSDFKKGEWSVIWDALFWRFVVVHSEVFEKNQRLSFLLRTWAAMDIKKKNGHLAVAEHYLNSMDNSRSTRLF